MYQLLLGHFFGVCVVPVPGFGGRGFSGFVLSSSSPSSGGGSGDSSEDIRLRTMASFSAQMRNVTKDDHVVRAMSLPAKFGSVAKAYVAQDLTFNTVDKVSDFINSSPLALS